MGAEWGAVGHSGGSLVFLQVVSIHVAGGRSLSRAGGLLSVCVEWQVLIPLVSEWHMVPMCSEWTAVFQGLGELQPFFSSQQSPCGIFSVV